MQDFSNIDIYAVLAQRKEIAFIWSTDDVQQARPDLSEDQAWEVLQTILNQCDRSCGGVTWETIVRVSHELFGDMQLDFTHDDDCESQPDDAGLHDTKGV